MAQPKVSVIIPVYNAEKYLRQCLDSVVNQTLKDIEIICVDDGSTDGSLRILREYEQKDDRVKILTQQNQYAGVARNNGIAIARGKYIAFLDADDFFFENAIEVLLSLSEKNNLDYVKGRFKYVRMPDGSIYEDAYSQNARASKVGAVISFTEDWDTLRCAADVPWNGLYKLSFLRENMIKFNHLRCVNNHSFAVHCMIRAQRAMIVDQYIAYYRVGQQDSLIGKKAQHFDCQIASYQIVKELCAPLEDSSRHRVMEYELRSLMHWYLQLSSNSSNAEAIDEYVLNFLDSFDERDVRAEYLRNFPYANIYSMLIKRLEWRKIREKLPFSNIEEPNNEIEKKIMLSVVIPIYNGEDNLRICLGSILRQPIETIEIICVNDGSTDDSLKLLHEYEKNDNRIVIIDKPQNEGTLLARKTGAMYARGKYITFIDADDAFVDNAFETMLRLIAEHPADILQFGVSVNQYTDSSSSFLYLQNVLQPQPGMLYDSDIMDTFFVSRKTATVQWGKIYRREPCLAAFSAMPDLYSYIGEDIYNCFFLSLYAKSYYGTEDKLYVYNYGLGVSNSDKMHLNKFEQYCRMSECVNELQRFVFKNDIENELAVYVETIGRRMLEDCCRHFSRDIVPADKTKAAELLLSYWSKVAFFNEVCLSSFGLNANEFAKRYTQIPNYEHISTFYGADSAIPEVTVIIPVFNVEQYLRECLDSIVNQTLQDIEIICVNDGSWDQSLSILEAYAAKDPRMTIISQTNGGLSSARNHGLRLAHGKYIYFIDSDDYLDTNALEILVTRAERETLDLVFFYPAPFYEEKRLATEFRARLRPVGYETVRSGVELLKIMRDEKTISTSACRVLIRHEMLRKNDISFYEGIIHEDELFCFQLFMVAQRAIYLSNVLYHRRVHAGSIMTTPKSAKNVIGYFTCMREMLFYGLGCDENTPERTEAMRSVSAMLWAAENIYHKLPSTEKVIFSDPLSQLLFEKILATPEPVSINKKAPVDREADQLRASWSYRIGHIIVWLPGKFKRGIQCCRDHGFRYTVRYGLDKIVRKLRGGIQCCYDHGLLYTLRYALGKLHLVKK